MDAGGSFRKAGGLTGTILVYQSVIAEEHAAEDIKMARADFVSF